MESKRILIIDDEEALRTALSTYLQLEGYAADTAASAEEALLMNLTDYDLLLLDVMMDGMSGTELATLLKSNSHTSSIPIIFLTAKDSDADMLAGLNLGADDYIAKPFSVKILVARIAAVLRRSPRHQRSGGSQREVANGVQCHRQSLSCTVDGKRVTLPRKEFELLALFLENRGRIFTRDELMDKVWPERTVITDRSIDVHITRLRKNISPYGKCIITRSGYGYGWQD